MKIKDNGEIVLKLDKPFYLDDLPFDYEKIDQVKLLRSLPKDLIHEALKWGANDTVVRENLFMHIVKNYLGYQSSAEYYADKGLDKIQELDYQKLESLRKMY